MNSNYCLAMPWWKRASRGCAQAVRTLGPPLSQSPVSCTTGSLTFFQNRINTGAHTTGGWGRHAHTQDHPVWPTASPLWRSVSCVLNSNWLSTTPGGVVLVPVLLKAGWPLSAPELRIGASESGREKWGWLPWAFTSLHCPLRDRRRPGTDAG